MLYLIKQTKTGLVAFADNGCPWTKDVGFADNRCPWTIIFVIQHFIPVYMIKLKNSYM
jgi:hypothetical protein